MTYRNARPPFPHWPVAPDPDHGLWELQRGSSTHTPYRTVGERIACAAGGLAEAGVGPGDRVIVALRGGLDFIAVLYGLWARGAAAVPLSPALAFVGDGNYAEFVARAVQATGATALICSPAEAAQLDGTAPPQFAPEQIVTAAPAHLTTPSPADVAVLQMTSGSTGPPKAVRVTHRCLDAQTAALHERLRWSPADTGALWLPMHHDMGIISVIATVTMGSDLYLMQPDDFIRRPLDWLRCFGEHGATLGPSPTFGIDHIARRVRPRQLDGLDLSGWRALILGAERIDPDVVERFLQLLGPAGLRRSVITPAYGMAETTLAATCTPVDTPAGAEPPPGATPDALPVVNCGPPVAGMAVGIEDDAGRSLPEGTLGEIVVQGTSVAEGYESAGGSLTVAFDGRIRTGDIGFITAGCLYVLGRAGDGVVLNGANIVADDVELAVGRVDGMPYRRHCVLLGQATGPPVAVIVTERALPQPTVEAARRVVRGIAGSQVQVDIVRVARGGLLRTTSGKPRRRAMWQTYLDGRLGDEPTTSDRAHQEVDV